MPLGITDRDRSNLEHAHWRVRFLLCLLDSHRTMPRKDPGWCAKEADYIQRLAAARAELARLEREY